MNGFLLAFVPDYNVDNSVSRYQIVLLNNTAHDIVYDLHIWHGEQRLLHENQLIKARDSRKLTWMPADYLSDNPLCRFELQQVTTSGLEASIARELKVRPKTFFKAWTDNAPILRRGAHVLSVLEKFPDAPTGEDLKSYTEEKLREQPAKAQGPRPVRIRPRIEELAAFPKDIDLHIEKLTADHASMDNAAILHLQLDSMERYLRDALRVGMEKVYLIHGVGEGKLRDAIHARLRRRPEIASFANKYFQGYGNGATEVIFR